MKPYILSSSILKLKIKNRINLNYEYTAPLNPPSQAYSFIFINETSEEAYLEKIAKDRGQDVASLQKDLKTSGPICLPVRI